MRLPIGEDQFAVAVVGAVEVPRADAQFDATGIGENDRATGENNASRGSVDVPHDGVADRERASVDENLRQAVVADASIAVDAKRAARIHVHEAPGAHGGCQHGARAGMEESRLYVEHALGTKARTVHDQSVGVRHVDLECPVGRVEIERAVPDVHVVADEERRGLRIVDGERGRSPVDPVHVKGVVGERPGRGGHIGGGERDSIGAGRADADGVGGIGDGALRPIAGIAP